MSGLIPRAVKALSPSRVGSSPCPKCGRALITSDGRQRWYRIHDIREDVATGEVTAQCRGCSAVVSLSGGAEPRLAIQAAGAVIVGWLAIGRIGLK